MTRKPELFFSSFSRFANPIRLRRIVRPSESAHNECKVVIWYDACNGGDRLNMPNVEKRVLSQSPNSQEEVIDWPESNSSLRRSMLRAQQTTRVDRERDVS
ncbi:hypothetical protein VTL71DRAFT_10452 [Oculimacula yallundae]|uniref:Uncharacterized protein n=1 Tax=Oculimacula yallundae TaxID=86028 RepID=A0ABR4CT24_9HELO